MTTERIDIIVSERGSRTVKRNIEDIGGSARAAAGGVQFLQRALLGLGASLGVAQLVRMADTYTLITNRLRLVTTGTANLARVNDELFASAQRSRSSYEATVALYSKLTRVAGQLGLGQKDLISITESLNQTFRISGATALEAEQSTRQLAQALGSGALRGDELVSVLEGNSRLAQVIADGMGVQVTQLKLLGEQGKLTTAEIISALQKAAPALQAEFGQLVPTIGEAFSVLRDSFMKFIGELDQSLGITAGLATAIIFLANNLDTLAQIAAVVAVALATAFAVSLVGSITAIISQVIALEMALGATSTAAALFSAALKAVQGGVRALTAAIAANPIGLLLMAITTIISYLYIFRDEISVTADGVVSLGDVFRAVFSFIGDLIGPVVDFFSSAWSDGVSTVKGVLGTFLDAVIDILSAVVSFAKAAVNTYIGMWVGAYKAIIAAWGLFGPAMKDLGVIAMNGLIEVVELAVNGIVKAVGNLLEFIGSAAELVGLNNPFAGLLDADVIDLSGFKGTVTGAAQDVAGIVRDEFASAFSTDYVGNLIGAVMDRAREIAVARAAQGGAGGLNPAGVPNLPSSPGGAGGGAGGGGAGTGGGGVSDLPDQMKRMKDILQDVRGPLDDYMADTQALDTLLQAGAITVDEYNQKWRDVRMTFLETQTDMKSGLELGLLQVQDSLGTWASNTANFVTSTFNTIGDAINNFVTTGKFSFSDFARSIIGNLAQIVTNMLILKPIAEALMRTFGGAGGGGGGGFLSGLFGGMFGGGGSLGFATGGGFTVGGGSGVDSQLVAFRATPGERVNVTRPGEEGNSGGGATQVTMNVYTQDAESFKRSEGQISAKLARMAQRGRRNL